MVKKNKTRNRSTNKEQNTVSTDPVAAPIIKTVVPVMEHIKKSDIFLWLPGGTLTEMYLYQTEVMQCIRSIFLEKGAFMERGKTKPKGLTVAKIKFYLEDDGFHEFNMNTLRKIIIPITTRSHNGLYVLV